MATMKKIMEGWRSYEKEVLNEQAASYSPIQTALGNATRDKEMLIAKVGKENAYAILRGDMRYTADNREDPLYHLDILTRQRRGDPDLDPRFDIDPVGTGIPDQYGRGPGDYMRTPQQIKTQVANKAALSKPTMTGVIFTALEASREEHPLATAFAEILLGMIPIVGQMIDVADIEGNALQGQYGDAALGAAAFVPILGDAIKIFKRPAVRAALGHGTEAVAGVIAQLIKTDPIVAKQFAKGAGDFASSHGLNLLDAGERQMALNKAEQLASDHIPPNYSEAQVKSAKSAATAASPDAGDKKPLASPSDSKQAGYEDALVYAPEPAGSDSKQAGHEDALVWAPEPADSTEDLIAANPQLDDPGEIDPDQEINFPTEKT